MGPSQGANNANSNPMSSIIGSGSLFFGGFGVRRYKDFAASNGFSGAILQFGLKGNLRQRKGACEKAFLRAFLCCANGADRGRSQAGAGGVWLQNDPIPTILSSVAQGDAKSIHRCELHFTHRPLPDM